MATQSPGIYFTEYDNTAYTNPKATSGTTVCIVGYANKGPIGEPTEITSWQGFKSTFGKPVSGYYSGLAVKNVLESGGTVLFVRVADETAAPSNFIVKNTVEGYNGYTKFDRDSDIFVGTSGYSNGKIYTLKVENTDGESKNFFVKSPASGKLTQSLVLQSLQEQLEALPATYEAHINSQMAEGIYSFNVSGTGINDDNETGDIYLTLNSNNVGDTFVQAIKQAIVKGNNAYYKVNLSNANEGIGTAFTANETANISGTKKFYIVLDNTETIINTKEFTNEDTYEDIANELDSKLKGKGIRVILSNEEVSEVDSPCLLFVDVSGTYSTVEVKSLSVSEVADTWIYDDDTIVNSKNLFTSSSLDTSKASTITNFISGKTESPDASSELGTFGLKIRDVDSRIKSDSKLNGFDVEYDSSVGSIVFKTETTGEDTTITLTAGAYGNSLLDCLKEIGSVEGQNALTGITITRDSSDKKIAFISDDLIPPKLSSTSISGDYYADLLTIEKNTSDKNSIGYTQYDGQDTVDPIVKDMVVFTTKEKGSGTAGNIAVDVYTSTSPVDNSSSTTLTVYVDGNIAETYEDISLNYADVENRFDTIINEDTDNGGSAYITVTVVKNDFLDEDVELPDGKYTIGAAYTADDILKDSETDYSAYNLYDYAVGTDGIPSENGSSLFEEAMKTGTSKLANKDLYDFHILITPDDITQTTQSAAVALCEDRGDAMAIIDPPVGLDVDSVIDWHNGRGYGRSVAVTSNFAATYWPWCKVYDSSSGTGKYTWVMPSVVMAAKYVTVDKTAGSWYAPAGETNGQLSVIDIEQYPNKLDRDNLYVDYNRVNPITKFKDGSIVVYGEKTLQRINSVLTKIHTRRMLIQIKKSCREALRGYIFMPNTKDYLGKISSNMAAILETYKAGGGLSAYKVVCDDTNNTTETSQQDIVNVDVYLVPQGTIEQINISLTLNKSEETVTD